MGAQPVQFWGPVVKLAFRLKGLVGWPDGSVVAFEAIVGKPDGVELICCVEVCKPVVLLSDATGMTNEREEEILRDFVGKPDDTGGTDVTLALGLGKPDVAELCNPERYEAMGGVKGGTVGAELLDKIVTDPVGDDIGDPEGVLITVLFEEIVGIPDEDDPPNEVLLEEVVGSPDGVEVRTPAEELLLADIVGRPEEAELVRNLMGELFDEIVENPEEIVEL